ncbi:AvrE-family type 3 secretion system effector [Klebsiella indica]|uniref:AvrE-family type 3 secretion system effector n=1 Tax=Klebsiella indica TaxID=2582917 RepID=A0A5R9LDL4_9ENTR|nr:AvrE-family type 3 secretion system effector [Klebsiella indica]TLV11625.1 AvrE-family type 3 secretion system effector [Klebsiella indica]
MLRIHGTEQKAAIQHVASTSHAASGMTLQQGSNSSSPQNMALSLAEEGKRSGAKPQIRQQSTATDGGTPARQQKKSFSLKSLLGLKKSAPPTPAMSASNRTTKASSPKVSLRDLLAQESAESSSPTVKESARLTRSGAVRRESLGDMAGRPMTKVDDDQQEAPVSGHQRQQQLNNFSQMRLATLNKLASTSSSPFQAVNTVNIPGSHHEIKEDTESSSTVGRAAASHDESAAVESDDDDSEFQQLHQQMLARERANPYKAPALGVETPLTAKFQPKLATITESPLEGESSLPLPLRGQPALQTQGRATVPLAMTLDNGKLHLAASNPPAINTLLQQTLGKEEQRYLAHHASSDGNQHLLLDNKGRLFDINSNGTSYSVLHNSQPVDLKARLAQAGTQEIALAMEKGSGRVTLNIGTERHALLRQPGEMHRALMTGIYSRPPTADRPQTEQFRLHDGKLHLLHPELDVWQAADNTPHSQLSRQADGKLYTLQDSRTLRNLSDNVGSEKFVDKIKSFAVSEKGQVAILTDTPSRHQMSLLPALNAAPESRISVRLQFADSKLALQHGQAHLEAQSVAISHGRLFVADSEGKLFTGPLPQQGETELAMKAMPQEALTRHFGEDHKIASFFTDDHGQLNAVVKDNFKQQHACPLANDHQFHPGWNLSDSLVIDNQLGLHQLNPEPHEILDMRHQGSLTLQEGKVHYFDQLTKSWTGAEADCQQLKKGLDGAAYILKDGEVKRLDINQSSASIKQGADNLFTLPHVRNKPEPGSALPGLDKADKAQAMAVIGMNHYLALTEKGDIRAFQLVPGTQQLARLPQTLSHEGIEGTLKDIHVDHQQNLYALNHRGELFYQPRADWQNNGAGSGWQKVSAPQGECALKRLDMNATHQPVATLEDGSQHLLTARGWQAHQTSEISPLHQAGREAQTVFNRLNQGVKGRVLPGTGVTVKMTAQVAGQSGMENRKVSSKFADRVRAYIFNPTMATPRPLKNAAYATQHQWQGRQGLKPLYEMQGALIKQLEAHNVRHKDTQPNLGSKLAVLDLGEHGKTLHEDLQRFCDELERSATRAATQLGQHQGVVKSNGEINPKYQPSRSKALVQSFNINRSGRDLSASLLTAVRAAPPSADSKLEKLLAHFISAGVNMSHQKGDVPLGRQRDPNDKTAITKSRLILDTVTLGELHQLVDKASLLSGHKPDAEQLQQLRQQFDTLREKQYGANPVKEYSDMGFSHHSALEADYDAVKAFINAFKKEHHGVNLAARTVLETHGNAELEQKLKQTLLSLDNGESISFSRSYSGGVSTAFVPTLKKVPVPIVPGAGVTLDRAYNLSFSRASRGLNVSFGRDGGMSGNISVSTGYDLMPYMTGKKATADNASDWLSKKHKISPDFRIGGGVSGSVQGTLQNSLKFKLTEDELPDFLRGLMQGTLTPVELIRKGIEHQTKQGSKLVFNVDTSAALDLRAGINLTEDGSKPNTVTARVSTGLSASMNLLSATRERSTTASQFGNAHSSSDNRPTFLNSASVGANLTATMGVAHASTNDGKSIGTFPAFASTNVSVALALDNRTSQSISVELKRAEPVTGNDISELMSTLGKHFTDTASSQLLAALKEQGDDNLPEQLGILHRHFSGQTVSGDERYEALRSLNKMVLRQQIAEGNGMELSSASHTTAYNNLSKLDSDGILHLLRQHFNAALPPSNAQRLSSFMESDPVLKGLIKQLQATPFSSARVSLELKDDLREQTERAMHDGKVGREEVGILFQDRNNLRIQSVSVSQSVSKSEGFSMPSLLLGANNSAGVSMERNIGTINFKYGQDQTIPRRFSLEGEIAKANPDIASALYELKKEGMEMKS